MYNAILSIGLAFPCKIIPCANNRPYEVPLQTSLLLGLWRYGPSIKLYGTEKTCVALVNGVVQNLQFKGFRSMEFSRAHFRATVLLKASISFGSLTVNSRQNKMGLWNKEALGLASIEMRDDTSRAFKLYNKILVFSYSIVLFSSSITRLQGAAAKADDRFTADPAYFNGGERLTWTFYS